MQHSNTSGRLSKTELCPTACSVFLLSSVSSDRNRTILYLWQFKKKHLPIKCEKKRSWLIWCSYSNSINNNMLVSSELVSYMNYLVICRLHDQFSIHVQDLEQKHAICVVTFRYISVWHKSPHTETCKTWSLSQFWSASVNKSSRVKVCFL